MLYFFWRPPEEPFRDISSITNKCIIAIDFQNAMSYIYSLYTGKYVQGSGFIPVEENGQIKMMSFDVKELAGAIVSDVIDLIYKIRLLASKYNVKAYIVFFADIGISQYHISIFKEYKANRVLAYASIDDPVLVHNVELVSAARKLSIKLLTELIKLIPDCLFITLDRLESDFIPLYLDKMYNPYGHIIMTLSNDSDMLQLVSDHHLVIRRILKKNKVVVYAVSLKNVATHMFKCDYGKYGEHMEKCVPMFTLAKSIIGDSSDGIPGIRSMGPVRTVRLISKMIDNGLRPEDIYDEDKLVKFLINHGISDDNCRIVLRNLCLVDYNRILEYFMTSEQEIKIRDQFSLLYEQGSVIDTLSLFNQIPGFTSRYQLHQLLTGQC